MPAPRKDDITNGRVRERGEAVEEESCFLYTNQPVCGGGKSAGAVLPLLAKKTNTFLYLSCSDKERKATKRL